MTMDPKNNDNQVIEITLRELEPLLRSSLGNELIVENYTTESFLLPGENYGSTILAVDAVIRRKKNDDKENLYMIAKMPPPTEFQRRIFNSSYTFRKEVSMYQTVIPAYRNLEKDYGMKEDELFDILPKYYGSRYSLDPKIDFDDNAAILLENLKHRGYYTGRREIGYDLDHSKLAIRAMARFHALGVVLKNKKPDTFEVVRKASKCMQVNTDEFENSYMPILKIIKENPNINVYYDKCEKIFTDKELVDNFFTEMEGAWSTIIHSDFWVNNIMFHKDENGHVDDVKFVDFQNYVYTNPIRELVFYLHSSTDDNVQANHLEDLVDLYYDTFISILKRFDCDMTPFSRENFNAEFPCVSKVEFLHLTFMIKVLTLNAKEANLDSSTMKTVMINYSGNDIFRYKLERLIVYFAQRNWI